MTDAKRDAAIRRNAPLVLFEVDGRRYQTPVLPINKADEWFALVDVVMETEKAAVAAAGAGDIVAARAARRAYARALFDCVFAYNPEALPRDAIEEHVGVDEVVSAFHRLVSATDPFEQVMEGAAEQQRIGWAAMEHLDKDTLGRLVGQHLATPASTE